ncbi:MAG: galactose-1-phosphate uridylyltransferase [Candidatus Doudnabacteria bacterium CG10_big_fil_rev_8_21_14_0_10_41_10]|uniref:Galactose-1-phosphate uridylyltransferase n=1 Tax=Candidatus Doudnabacteria bacterium CG10_big_fil_rev_8_21_14_0_10_41_10 TaxID=1974551 RepID=A0A2H0VE42_9BACT|nr:MAG: galactose-1-phosphate uridylyltransferase [Candidatus Doudnabacteria bacterium CG10_big_fil_rev_8_21_14_0_10_41_10]
MSEFRQDIVTKEWVLVASLRSGRPHEFSKSKAIPEGLPESDPKCVFCVGNESKTPPEILRLPKNDNWQVRVVPNKFGLLELNQAKTFRNFYVSLPGIGSHEVVLTRAHNQPTALKSVELIDQVLEVYIKRINDLKKYNTVKYVHIIQNHGKLAGASLIHPHSQIFAMPFLGPHLQEELRGANGHYQVFDKCIYCDIIAYELTRKARIVLETRNFLVICPYESKMPYQMRIMPKKHQANFNEISIEDRKELAAVIKSILSKLYYKLNNPAYNYYIHSMPFRRSKNVSHNEKAYHWHMVIMPRINIWAGLELGTEIYVNVMPPEEAAEYLRGE